MLKIMEKNTITYLKTKAWYRFLKVIYILAFLVLILFLLYFVYGAYRPIKGIDQNNTLIFCTNGKIYSASEINTGSRDLLNVANKLCDTGEVYLGSKKLSDLDFAQEFEPFLFSFKEHHTKTKIPPNIEGTALPANLKIPPSRQESGLESLPKFKYAIPFDEFDKTYKPPGYAIEDIEPHYKILKGGWVDIIKFPLLV